MCCGAQPSAHLLRIAALTRDNVVKVQQISELIIVDSSASGNGTFGQGNQEHGPAVARKKPAADDVVTIKKYANRRLYNTATSSYVTLEHLAEMVREGTEFVVKDAKTGEDITRAVLGQIIFEQESKGQHLLPIRFLRQLIRLYGDSLQAFVPSYLELSMETFSREQEKIRDRLSGAFGGRERLNQLEDQIRQNFSMFENALRMLAPFGSRTDAQTEEQESAKPATKSGSKSQTAGRDAEIETLKKQLASMQKQLDAIARKSED